MYTLGQVSEQFDLPVSTLRYYDKEGLFPALTRTSGIRHFGEQELEALRVIECLKRSGLEIKEIKQFMEWCAQGSETYPQRHALFVQQAERVEAEIARLQKSLDMIRFKCWYYEQAMRDGSEDRVHAMLPDQLPPDIQPIYDPAPPAPPACPPRPAPLWPPGLSGGAGCFSLRGGGVLPPPRHTGGSYSPRSARPRAYSA